LNGKKSVISRTQTPPIFIRYPAIKKHPEFQTGFEKNGDLDYQNLRD
jgi:hypothetical protein